MHVLGPAFASCHKHQFAHFCCEDRELLTSSAVLVEARDTISSLCLPFHSQADGCEVTFTVVGRGGRANQSGDILMLRQFGGKKLLIVEHRPMLTAACRDRLVNAGATLIGPLRSPEDILDALVEGGVDGAILDVGADDETLVSAFIILERANVPFVFASRAKSDRGGFSMSGGRQALREIADALFGPPGASFTLH